MLDVNYMETGSEEDTPPGKEAREIKRAKKTGVLERCHLCGHDQAMVPDSKVCCRLLKLNGQHQPRTTDWKGENESGLTREIRQTSGDTYEWTGRIWCAIRDFCHCDAFKKAGSTQKCCAEHRDFFKNSQAKRKAAAEVKKVSKEGGRVPVDVIALNALVKQRDNELAERDRVIAERDGHINTLEVELDAVRQESQRVFAQLCELRGQLSLPPPESPPQRALKPSFDEDDLVNTLTCLRDARTAEPLPPTALAAPKPPKPRARPTRKEQQAIKPKAVRPRFETGLKQEEEQKDREEENPILPGDRLQVYWPFKEGSTYASLVLEVCTKTEKLKVRRGQTPSSPCWFCVSPTSGGGGSLARGGVSP